MKDIQEHHDTFYFRHGKCCAGCDYWRYINSLVGECTQSKIIPGRERMSMINVQWTSSPIVAGHAITKRDYVCGRFLDTFDWSSLPLPYRKLVGAPVIPASQ